MICPLNVTLVGGGSSAHVLVALLSGAGHQVSVLTHRPSEWNDAIELRVADKNNIAKCSFFGKLTFATNDPAKVIPQSNVIIFCMPVYQYRNALNWIAPHIRNTPQVHVGTIYGQAGFNWMIRECQQKLRLENISYFSIGLIPWITRTIEYGHIAVTYGPKAVNAIATSSQECFDFLERNILDDMCFRWFHSGKFVLVPNFLSLTLCVDNQIIHPARCYGLYKVDAAEWKDMESVPYFYRDFDEISANILRVIDREYSNVRNAILSRFSSLNGEYMLDYLALERFSYASHNEDIRLSFVNSSTLGAIKPPTVVKDGKLVIDANHRFFLDMVCASQNGLQKN